MGAEEDSDVHGASEAGEHVDECSTDGVANDCPCFVDDEGFSDVSFHAGEGLADVEGEHRDDCLSYAHCRVFEVFCGLG